MKRALLTLAVLAVPIASGAALAHHSYAMFDMQKTVVLDAQIIRFKWQNPHAFIEAQVTSPAGTEKWSIEMTSPKHYQDIA